TWLESTRNPAPGRSPETRRVSTSVDGCGPFESGPQPMASTDTPRNRAKNGLRARSRPWDPVRSAAGSSWDDLVFSLGGDRIQRLPGALRVIAARSWRLRGHAAGRVTARSRR